MVVVVAAEAMVALRVGTVVQVGTVSHSMEARTRLYQEVVTTETTAILTIETRGEAMEVG